MGEVPFGSYRTGPDQMIPPLARRVWPLIQAPSGPARNATASAMSWGWPRRSSGAIFDSWSISSWGLPSRNSLVAIGPGAIALTAQLLGEDAGHGLDRGLGGGINAIGRY